MIYTFGFFRVIMIFFSLVVAEPPGNNRNHAPVNTVYFTFDDGPLEGSGNISDIISKEQIPINVFVVGEHILAGNKPKLEFNNYLANPFIEVGNHSFSHAHNHYQHFYNNADSVYSDFMHCYNQFKIPTRFCRLPGRNMWRLPGTIANDVPSGKAAADELFKNGFYVFGWDLEWSHDPATGAPIQTVDDMLSLISSHFKQKKTLHPGHLVILLHDEMFRNSWEESELKSLIDQLRAKGDMKFDHLSHYPGSGLK